jgi:hypothetical protein
MIRAIILCLYFNLFAYADQIIYSQSEIIVRISEREDVCFSQAVINKILIKKTETHIVIHSYIDSFHSKDDDLHGYRYSTEDDGEQALNYSLDD